MQKTQVRSLCWDDPLDKEMAPAPVFLLGKSHGQQSWAGYSPQGRKESDTTETKPPPRCLSAGPEVSIWITVLAWSRARVSPGACASVMVGGHVSQATSSASHWYVFVVGPRRVISVHFLSVYLHLEDK